VVAIVIRYLWLGLRAIAGHDPMEDRTDDAKEG